MKRQLASDKRCGGKWRESVQGACRCKSQHVFI